MQFSSFTINYHGNNLYSYLYVNIFLHFYSFLIEIIYIKGLELEKLKKILNELLVKY